LQSVGEAEEEDKGLVGEQDFLRSEAEAFDKDAASSHNDFQELADAEVNAWLSFCNCLHCKVDFCEDAVLDLEVS